MLTSRQYEAVGRLALAFNEIEWAFEMYMAHLIGAPEWSASLLFAGEGMFRHKAERFDRLLKALAEGRPVLQAQIAPIRQWVKRAKELADRRNEYVHALVVDDFETNTTLLRIKGIDTVCNEDEINCLAAEAAVLVNQMHTDCGDLLVTVEEARSQATGDGLYSTAAPTLEDHPDVEDSQADG